MEDIMSMLVSLGAIIVVLLVLRVLAEFILPILIPIIIFAAIGAFLGYLLDGTFDTGSFFTIVGGIIGGGFGIFSAR